MNKERLGKLADFLVELVENGNKFNMAWWISRDECGTTACALGWAASIPEFIDLGLRVTDADYIEYNGVFNIEAAMEFFEMDYYEASDIFYGYGLKHGCKSTKEEVVEYIRNLIK